MLNGNLPLGGADYIYTVYIVYVIILKIRSYCFANRASTINAEIDSDRQSLPN